MGPRRSSELRGEVFLKLVLLQGLLFGSIWCETHKYVFNVRSTPYTRLCQTKHILTINGQFPGPTLYGSKGDTIIVKVKNHAHDNITLHWHGVKQPRNPWSDGPEYITQCPIRPGNKFIYVLTLSSEEGTIWWHAHSDWTRATVHGAIVVYPNATSSYPFPNFHNEFILILGEWWKLDMREIYENTLKGLSIPVSDAWTINGQPGHQYPCSKSGTFRMQVDHGKRYLLRVINAGLSNGVFFSISRHRLTVVGSDGSYTKPFTTDFIMIAPGESMDLLLEANKNPNELYYMAARSFSYQPTDFNPNTTTAILHYNTNHHTSSSSPSLPYLPYYNDTDAATKFDVKLRSLADKNYPVNVPKDIDQRMYITVSVNSIKNGTILKASLNNNSFEFPKVDILEAYYYHTKGFFTTTFPSKPPLYYNFTADDQPTRLLVPSMGTRVRVLNYGARVEIVFQGTSLVLAEDHPLHLHGYSFYVMGRGFGNFDRKRDPLGYNYVDPPKKNTVEVPRNGWVAIRFRANNPGVWYLHCHLERHLTWGMTTAFIVKNGISPSERMLSRPSYMPPC
ncbi:laccase-15-like [Typha latifolia]|uniref:laccase-15-like n=1 Tax=Typha latifolia TaxID=4733 RepID=UPI003C2CEA7B